MGRYGMWLTLVHDAALAATAETHDDTGCSSVEKAKPNSKICSQIKNNSKMVVQWIIFGFDSSLLMLYYFCETCGSKKRTTLGVWGKVVQRNCTVIMRRQKEEQWVSSVSFPITTQQRHRMLHVQGESRV